MARSRFCVHCGNEAKDGLALCPTCVLGIEKYADQNPPILRAYCNAGHAEIATFLTHHAEFQRWLNEHPNRKVNP